MFFRGAHDGGERPQAGVESTTPTDPEANASRAARRARTKVRLYAASNGIDRLMTLTYAPPFCFDSREAYDDTRRFVRRLRHSLARPFPYVWVQEPHHDQERLHVHIGLGQYVPKTQLQALWPHGFVDIRRIRARTEEGKRAKAQKTAQYLSKYVGKLFDRSSGDGCGHHRYEVGQGFQPRSTGVLCSTESEAWRWVMTQEGGATPAFQWSSEDIEGWEGPPTRGVRW